MCMRVKTRENRRRLKPTLHIIESFASKKRLCILQGNISRLFTLEYSVSKALSTLFFGLLFIFTSSFTFKESALAHQLLDGLRGLEIGGSAHNPFGLRTLNVDWIDDPFNPFKQEEIALCGRYLPVDIVAPGDDLPFKDNSIDFVISSHVIEHFYDPIKTIQEWLRVVRPGGYVYMIVPHKERTFDSIHPRTVLAELIQRHEQPNPPIPDHHGHYSIWITEDFIDLCRYYSWPICAIQDVDDKVGNGFTIVIQKLSF